MSPKKILRSVKIIYYFMLISPAVLLFFLFLSPAEKIIKDNLISVLYIGVLLIAIIPILFVANWFINKKIEKIISEKFLRIKLMEYLKIKTLEYALYEMTLIFAALSFLIVESFALQIIFAILYIFFFIKRPSVEKIAEDLKLNSEELRELQ